MTRPSVLAVYDEGVLSILLSNAAYGNSFGVSEAEQLQKILIRHRQARVLIFRSSGRLFCSGGNLQRYSKMSRAEGVGANRKIRKVLTALAEHSAVKLAVVEGDCFGGGTELLSCFDVVWSIPYALFGFWQRKMALCLGWNGDRRLSDRIRFSTLKRLSLSSETFSAERAWSIGLVDRIVAPGRIDAEIHRLIVNETSLPERPLRALRSRRTQAAHFDRMWRHSRPARRFE